MWGILLGAVLILSALYLLFLFLPAPVPALVGQYFSPAELERARRYQQTVRLLGLAAYLTKAGLLWWLWWSGQGASMARLVLKWSGHRYCLALALFFGGIWLLLRLAELPFTFSSGFVVQHRWGFSTQGLLSWWLDYLKGSGLDLLFSGIGTLLLFWSTARWPTGWWAAAGLFLAAWMVIETMLWPVFVAPLFNRFEPVADGPIKDMVVRLAGRAGMEVEEVLVMDASRRTTKANAYFAGLGGTKRIVLYDTLLKNYPPEEIEAVVAHEIAHWARGHIVRSLVWGIAGGFALFGALYAVLRISAPGEALRGGPYAPHILIIIWLFFHLLSFLALPVQNSLSRQLEREADRVALELTGNIPAMVQLHVDLARCNLQDVAPAPFVEWLTYSHPAPWRRIEAALKAW
ncbi:MAG: M48 family metallopeptidase [Thermoanaerobacteraceae bacterium]|nr:M48 family metallopeptidase [Thermoanaerobacteraceae bacterium]